MRRFKNFSPKGVLTKTSFLAQIAKHDLEESDDMAWAKPAVDEGLAALERGDVMTIEEHKARNVARLASIKR